jgi:hypothetical protein
LGRILTGKTPEKGRNLVKGQMTKDSGARSVPKKSTTGTTFACSWRCMAILPQHGRPVTPDLSYVLMRHLPLPLTSIDH